MECRIGIDLGGTGIKAAAVDESHAILARRSVPTAAQRSFERVVDDMAEAARTVAREAGVEIARLSSIGVGSPGGIDRRTGLLAFSNNTAWRNVPLKQSLEARLGIPVSIENDANCAMLGEAVAGAARGAKNAVMLTLGTGVGGGVLIDGKLFTGGDGLGAELGHMPFLYGGAACTCGKRGCLEAYVSVRGLVASTKKAMEKNPSSLMHDLAAKRGAVTGKTAFDAARQSDRAAMEVVKEYTEMLACGIGALVSIFRPEIVLIGGGLSNEGDYLIKPLNALLEKEAFAGDIVGVPPIVRAALGNDAGVIGAAHLSAVRGEDHA